MIYLFKSDDQWVHEHNIIISHHIHKVPVNDLDVWPWKPFQFFRLVRWIFVTSFIEIISTKETDGQTDELKTVPPPPAVGGSIEIYGTCMDGPCLSQWWTSTPMQYQRCLVHYARIINILETAMQWARYVLQGLNADCTALGVWNVKCASFLLRALVSAFRPKYYLNGYPLPKCWSVR